MTFFNGSRGRDAPNWLFMLISIMAATAMWYWVCVRERIEAQVEINIDYTGIPQDLIVTNGLVNKMTVRLRGPETLLRSVVNQNIYKVIKLSNIKKGVTIVPFPTTDISPTLRAFDVVDIQPPRMVVTADNLIERSVPVKAIIDSPLGSDALTVENISVSPATIMLKGPEETILKMSNVPLIIHVDPKKVGASDDQIMNVDTPSLVTSMPSAVRVRYSITSGRKIVSCNCKIMVAEDASHHYSVSPKSINVLVEVPEALASSNSYLKKLEAYAMPPPLEPGQSAESKIQFRLPDGMTLVRPDSEEVTITRSDKRE